MKDFINKTLFFCTFSVLLTGILIMSTTCFKKYSIDFELTNKVNILVVGDSHTECAINDKIVPNLFNFSESGAGYFYSYLKIRKILQCNQHINTVVLSYTYNDISVEKDEWFDGPTRIKYEMPKYFYLFRCSDFLSILSSNPYHVIINLPRVLLSTFSDKSHLGGYLYLQRDKLELAKERYLADDKKKQFELSIYQVKYLQKIYDLVNSRGVKLILLHVPLHHLLYQNVDVHIREQYNLLIREKLPEAFLINHSEFKIPDFGFGDLEHLNHKGAKIYSEFIKKNGFGPLRNAS